jgi:hypothetical protein
MGDFGGWPGDGADRVEKVGAHRRLVDIHPFNSIQRWQREDGALADEFDSGSVRVSSGCDSA